MRLDTTVLTAIAFALLLSSCQAVIDPGSPPSGADTGEADAPDVDVVPGPDDSSADAVAAPDVDASPATGDVGAGSDIGDALDAGPMADIDDADAAAPVDDIDEADAAAPGEDTETSGGCKTSADCADMPLTACHVWTCDEPSGECTESPLDDGPCDDGNTCTVDDVCSEGACVGTGINDCDDGDACTEDSCAGDAFECVHEAIDCTDDDPCTTAEACDPATGCTAEPAIEGTDCSDGDVCTAAAECDGQGQCLVQLACADLFEGKDCMEVWCVPETGACEWETSSGCFVFDECVEAGASKPGDACAVCDPGYDPYDFLETDCDDQDDCTIDTCDAASGSCAHTLDEAACPATVAFEAVPFHTVFDVWGSPEGELYAVGYADTGSLQPVVAQRDGGAWPVVWQGPVDDSFKQLVRIHGSGGDDIWAVGAPDQLVHYDGESWSTVALPAASCQPRDVWAGGGQVFVACDKGKLFRFDGLAWQVDDAGAENHGAIHGCSHLDVWAGTESGGPWGWDGASWMASDDAGTLDASSSYGTLCIERGGAPRATYLAGQFQGVSGFVARFEEGGGGQLLDLPTTARINDVVDIGSYGVLAVGVSGTILHGPPDGLATLATGDTSWLNGAWSNTATGEVWIAAGESVIHLRFAGCGDTDCDDGDPCTVDLCDHGACLHPVNAADCDDADPYTVHDVCSEGVCAGSSACDCDDGDACTEDSCGAGGLGCVYAPIDCSDDDPCTVDEACDPGSGCTSAFAPDGASCSDGDVCTTGDACDGQGACVAQPACAGLFEGQDCMEVWCDPATGSCEWAVLWGCFAYDECFEEGAPAPGDACAVCDPGVDPNGLVPVDCDDGDPCTDDLCDHGACLHPTNAADCDDADPFTVADVCVAGVCVGTSLCDCDDGDACTKDACEPEGAGCTHLPLDCSDDDPCTFDEACDPGTGCTSAFAPDGAPCSDGDLCTTGDACDGQGQCVAEPACAGLFEGQDCMDVWCVPETGACESALLWGCFVSEEGCFEEGATQPGDACMVCDPAIDPSAFQPADCDDGDACTTDTCESDGAGCAHAAVDCSDEDPCTVDEGCDPAGGCTSAFALEGTACSDDDLCTTGDACDGEGQCVTKPACAGLFEGQDCMEVWCVPETGACESALLWGCFVAQEGCFEEGATQPGDACMVCDPAIDAFAFQPADCDDGDACTTDTCDSDGAGCAHVAVDCSDEEPCTIGEGCDPASGCTWTPATDGTACSDGDICTAGDACDGQGTCVAQPACAGLFEGKDCMDVWCEPETGACEWAVQWGCFVYDACFEEGAANPGDPCEVCDPTSDPYGFLAVDCDDLDACTVDSCDALSGGCLHELDEAACPATITFEPVPFGTAYDVWGTADGDLYAVGSDDVGEIVPVVAKRGAGEWPVVWQGAVDDDFKQLIRIHGSGPNDIWVAGGPNQLVHFDGDSWSIVPLPASSCPSTRDVWAAAGQVFVACDNGTIVRFDGASWSVDSAGGEDHGSIHGCSPFDVWSGTEDSDPWRWDGAVWTGPAAGGLLQSSASYGTLCVAREGAPRTTYVAGQYSGSSGLVARYEEGGVGETLALPTTHRLNDVVDLGSYGILAVGTAGTILYGPPDDLALLPTGDTSWLNGAWSRTATAEAWIAASDQVVHLRFAGCEDTDCDDGDPCTDDLCDHGACLHPLATAACDDGDPCTDDLCDQGACLHPFNTVECDDGNACTTDDVCADGVCLGLETACADLYEGKDCIDVWCEPDTGTCDWALAWGCFVDDECIAEGGAAPEDACEICDPAVSTSELVPVDCYDADGCTIDSCDATTGACEYALNEAWCPAWVDVELLYGDDVWGSSPDDLYVMKSGSILHREGAEWVSQWTVTGGSLQAIHGSGPGDVWAVGNGSPNQILHSDGDTWSHVELPPFVAGCSQARDVWAGAANNVFIACEYNFLRFDGATWTSHAVPGKAHYGVAGCSTQDVWGATDGDALWQWNGTTWSSPGLGGGPAQGFQKSAACVFRDGAREVLVAGWWDEGGFLSRYVGGDAGQSLTLPSSAWLLDVADNGAYGVLAVGKNDTVVYGPPDALAMTSVVGSSNLDLLGVWTHPPTGEAWIISHYKLVHLVFAGCEDTDCDDGDPCTDDLCDHGACLHPFNAADCDDGDACTIQDSCADGACAGIDSGGCGG